MVGWLVCCVRLDRTRYRVIFQRVVLLSITRPIKVEVVADSAPVNMNAYGGGLLPCTTRFDIDDDGELLEARKNSHSINQFPFQY